MIKGYDTSGADDDEDDDDDDDDATQISTEEQTYEST